jgi:hypothetical protein
MKVLIVFKRNETYSSYCAFVKKAERHTDNVYASAPIPEQERSASRKVKDHAQPLHSGTSLSYCLSMESPTGQENSDLTVQ